MMSGTDVVCGALRVQRGGRSSGTSRPATSPMTTAKEGGMRRGLFRVPLCTVPVTGIRICRCIAKSTRSRHPILVAETSKAVWDEDEAGSVNSLVLPCNASATVRPGKMPESKGASIIIAALHHRRSNETTRRNQIQETTSRP
eukprot:1366561-Rhodomonas_salina.1